MNNETIQEMNKRFHKERELEYKEAKEKITFQLIQILFLFFF